ncbi:Protein of unknown function (DUF3727) [Seminavis robusta]|uniref:Uncharacterized protein n=1 Tax=Seminavis robusta TaxID=568900 RepID=A0A9N8EDA9_9STRA|nr:Protein of unknown function (DUF3727) [Seminavis robusta]|eukprot:Sro922_g220640.1 Protein of unknown function (DUF3727) (251) ;mRNA; r:36699-37451
MNLMIRQIATVHVLLFVLVLASLSTELAAFTPLPLQPRRQRLTTTAALALAANSKFRPIPSEQEGIPIPFIDTEDNSFIECYADCIAVVEDVEYTIGVPCDYAVALCYFRDEDQLVPIELDDKLMDDIYPMAESILEEEFADELVLQRTPQTLTLVGELEDDDDEDDDLRGDSDDDDDGEEEVEVLLSFEHDGRQYNLVRMLDPMLLVGKVDPADPECRLLLSQQESDKVMPILEGMFLDFNEERDDVKP